MGTQFFVGGLTMGIKTFLWFTCLISASMAVTRPVRTPWASLMQRLRREVVDLHSGEFCVDVSTYGLVEFEPTPREKCDSTFNKFVKLRMSRCVTKLPKFNVKLCLI